MSRRNATRARPRPHIVKAAGGRQPVYSQGQAVAFTPDQIVAMLHAARGTSGEAQPLPRVQPLVPFGPGVPLFPQPINPVDPDTGRAEPRQNEYRVAWNLPGFSDRLVPWSVLRAAADQISLFRRCIEIRKKEVATLSWDVTVSERAIERAQQTAGTQSRAEVEKAMREKVSPLIGRYADFWEQPDRRGELDFIGWAKKLLEEHFVLDAVAIYPRRTVGGDLFGFEILDGSTIKPLLDTYGFKPAAPEPAYQQILWGFPRGEFIADAVVRDDGATVVPDAYQTDQLIYRVDNVRTFTPYGYSAVEQALDDGDLYLRRHGWLKAEYTDGVMPAGWLKAGAGQAEWTPTQLAAYEKALNDYYSGQTAQRQRFRILPYGMEPDIRADLGERYRPDYDLHLIKLTAGHFDTTIAELGFTEPGGLGSTGWHEGQADVQDRKATQPTLRMLQSLITQISRRHLGMPRELEFRIRGLESEDEDAQDEVAQRRVAGARMTLNEDRDRQGLARYTFPEADMPFTSTGRGIVFMEGASTLAPPGSLIGPGAPASADPGAQVADDTTAAADPADPAANDDQGSAVAAARHPVRPTSRPAAKPAAKAPPAADGGQVAKAELAAYRRWAGRGAPRGRFEFTHLAKADAAAAGVDLAHATFKAEAGGGGDPKVWAAWQRDEQLARHYAPLISRALLGQINPEQLTEAWLLHKADSGPVAAALHWLGERVAGVVRALTRVFTGVYTEGYWTGQASAEALLSAGVVDWGGWTPGDPEAARILIERTGGQLGLQRLLSAAGVTIGSVAQHRLGELAEVLADGIAAGTNADALTRKVAAVLDDPKWAYLVALTEITRAVTAATLDSYGERGTRRADWFTALDDRVCPVCHGNAAAGPVAVGHPFPSGDTGPPAHPNCRCALAPADEEGDLVVVKADQTGVSRRHDDRTDHHKGPDYTPADIGLDRLHDVEVDPREVRADQEHYQRPLDGGRVEAFEADGRKKLAKRWGLVAQRPDGSLWLINGQHHTAAAVALGVDEMRYRAFDSTGWRQERQVYLAWQQWHDRYEEHQ